MYSLNVPVPGSVERLAADFHPRLLPFDRIRERHTLVCKRLGEGSVHRMRERLRATLADTPRFQIRLSGVDYFAEPTRGTGPVIYFAVESPELVDLHERLCAEFDPISGLEGDDYVPHITLARGGSVADAESLRDSCIESFEPVSWTVTDLSLWSAEYRESAATIRLGR